MDPIMQFEVAYEVNGGVIVERHHEMNDMKSIIQSCNVCTINRLFLLTDGIHREPMYASTR